MTSLDGLPGATIPNTVHVTMATLVVLTVPDSDLRHTLEQHIDVRIW